MEKTPFLDSVSSFDGTAVRLAGRSRCVELGNFLGGGVAGQVYEAVDEYDRSCAVKILNPIAYKLERSVVENYERASTESVGDGGAFWMRKRARPAQSGLPNVILCRESVEGAIAELTLKECVDTLGVAPDAKKLLPVKYKAFLAQRSALFREIDAMRRLNEHPNVLKLHRVLESVQDSKYTVFLVLELASGGELFDRIRENEGCGERVAAHYFEQLLKGVQYCHRKGVCHRDLKPENLLLCDAGDDGSLPTLKIADFGLSGQTTPAAAQSLGMHRFVSVVGSPHYTAPEILLSDTCLDGYEGEKADAWSVGVILYALVAGKLPFSNRLLSCSRFLRYKKWRQSRDDKVDVSSSSLLSPRFTPNDPIFSGVDDVFACEDDDDEERHRRKSDDNDGDAYPGWFFPQSTSDPLKDLLSKLLHPSPDRRIDVAEALRHEWLAEVSDVGASSVEKKAIEEDDDELLLATLSSSSSSDNEAVALPPSIDSSAASHEADAQPMLFTNRVQRSTRFLFERDPLCVLDDVQDFLQSSFPSTYVAHVDADEFVCRVYERGNRDVEEYVDFATIRVYLVRRGCYLCEFVRSDGVGTFEFKSFYRKVREALFS